MVISLIIFDLDGVLADAREIHYESMNRALSAMGEKPIAREEHLAKYDGLPTRKKLEKLTNEKGLSREKHNDIWKEKQKVTTEVISDIVKYDERMVSILKLLKEDGYTIYCASNSIMSTIRTMLDKIGCLKHIDFIISNEDVSNPKPHSEIYLRCMVEAGVNPKETLIIEDSHLGRKSAHESGGNVLGVIGPHEVTTDNIYSAIDKYNNINKSRSFKPKWQGKNLNVLIPMAGAGSRFKDAGYTFPKPLIEINGKPMIQMVVENLNIDSQHIFIVQKEHYERYNLQYVLNLISPQCQIIQTDGMTEGAACTTLLARDLINTDNELVIANSDQIVEWDSNEFLYSMQADKIDAGILTFNSFHPKWSFAKIDNNGLVTQVAEKRPISNLATVGIYYWKKGKDYVKYADQMIQKNKRINNEFYVCPVFNEAIEDGKKIKTFNVERMWGLGTPEDLATFLTYNQAKWLD